MKHSGIACESCPAPVDLSSWVDGEGTDQLGTHVRVCPTCQRVVAFYRRADGAVRSATTAPPGLADRIASHCRELPRERPVFWLHPSLLRVAAVLAMVATAAALVSVSLRPRGDSNGAAPRPSVASVADDGTVDGPFTAYTGTSAEPVRVVTEREVAHANASGGASNARYVYQPASAASLRRAIPRRVSHVWVVPDLERCRTEFLRRLPADARSVTVDAGEGVLGFRVLLRDDKLKSLVDSLAGLDYSLVSAGLPQPRDSVSVPSKQNVVYGVQFVASRPKADE